MENNNKQKRKLPWNKISIVAVVILMITGVFFYKNAITAEGKLVRQEQMQAKAQLTGNIAAEKGALLPAAANTAAAESQRSNTSVKKVSTAQSLPRLLDFGAEFCGPCREQAPILEALKGEYAGRVNIDMLDVYANRQDAEKNNIRVIPTQIFFDAAGNEFLRHEGLMSKAEIEAVFAQMGVK